MNGFGGMSRTVLALSLGLTLAGCETFDPTSFDPTSIFESDIFNQKAAPRPTTGGIPGRNARRLAGRAGGADQGP